MAIKVAFIGAGSVGFTRRLFRDILTVPELNGTTFTFNDISKTNLDMVVKLCKKDLANNKHVSAKIEASTNRKRMLEGADYVINCSRIGGIEAFKTDIEIPLKFGVDQCVGDTLCIGGIMYGQRNIPALLQFCEDMHEVSNDGVLLLNYANPNAINTWAVTEYGGIDCVGLCHGVFNTAKMLAGALGVKDMSQFDFLAAGINHQTWFLNLAYKGKTISAEKLLKSLEADPALASSQKIRIDILKRFGYFSTESNGHLSEYLPWYRKRPGDLRKWIDMKRWGNGETAGYLRHCTEKRNWFVTDFPEWLKATDPPIAPEIRSHEHGSYIIESLETGRSYRGHFNLQNNGCITNLPKDCIVEVPCFVDRNGIQPVSVGDLPLACAATLSASVNVQRMAMLAGVTGDVTLLKQAVLHDPLTGAVCNPPEIWQMVDEMLIAQAKWLPQYRREIPKARKRMKAEKYLGTRYVKGARLKTKTVKELRATGNIADIMKVAAKTAED